MGIAFDAAFVNPGNAGKSTDVFANLLWSRLRHELRPVTERLDRIEAATKNWLPTAALLQTPSIDYPHLGGALSGAFGVVTRKRKFL